MGFRSVTELLEIASDVRPVRLDIGLKSVIPELFAIRRLVSPVSTASGVRSATEVLWRVKSVRFERL